MLEKIQNLIREQVSDTVDRDPAIPEEKKSETVNTATSSIFDSLKSYATPENISKLTALFSKNGAETEKAQENGITQGIQSNLVGNLISKVGLSSGMASSLAASLLPALISKLTNKVNDPNDSGFDLGSIIGAFTGGGNKTSAGKGGGLMDMVGSFFGGK